MQRFLVAFAAAALVVGAAPAGAVAAASASSTTKARPAVPDLIRERLVARHAAGTPVAAPRAVAPAVTTPITGPAVVYAGYSNTGWGLYSRNLVTGTVRTILPPAGDLFRFAPALSPDGTQVAFLQAPDVNGTPNVYVANIDGTGLVRLETSADTQQLPNWKPDGSRVLFTQTSNDFQDAAVQSVPPSGGTPTTVVPNAYNGRYSPDGSEIAFGDETTNQLGIYTVASGTRSLIAPGDYVDVAAWAPDGSRLVFDYLKRDVNGELQGSEGLSIINADGSGNSKIAATRSSAVDAWGSTWSADGTEIYYNAAPFDAVDGLPTAAYDVMSVDAGTGYRTAKVTVTSDVDELRPGFVGPGPSAPAASTFTPVTPERILDTRQSAPLRAGGTVDVLIAGAHGVPGNATAAVLNLTGISPTTGTDLRIYPTPPSGSAYPVVSNLNLATRQTAAVLTQVKLGAGGRVRLRNAGGSVHVALDLAGYFTADTTGARFAAVGPARVLDTRTACGFARLGPGATGDVTVTGTDLGCGANKVTVPADATAVVLNLTGVRPTSFTDVRAYPTPAGGGGVPGVSNLNVYAGAVRANLVTVAVGTGGKVRFRNAGGSIDLLADLAGYYRGGGTGQRYYALEPLRVFDTRYGIKTPYGAPLRVGAAGTIDMLGVGTITTSGGSLTVPAGAGAVLFNLTGVGPTTTTDVRAYPTLASGSDYPAVSTLNSPAGAIVANLTVVAPGAEGLIRLRNAGGTINLLADLFGYYAP